MSGIEFEILNEKFFAVDLNKILIFNIFCRASFLIYIGIALQKDLSFNHFVIPSTIRKINKLHHVSKYIQNNNQGSPQE